MSNSSQNSKPRRSVELGILLLLGTIVVGCAAAPAWIFSHMLPAERVAVVLFLAVVSAVYVTAGWMLIESLTARLQGKTRQDSRRATWARRSILALAGSGMGCIA